MTSKKYSDPALTPPQLLARLRDKKLVIQNENFVIHCLKTVGYHRLSAYFEPFKIYHSSNWTFHPETTFDNIWQLYVFDRELRLLVTDALERIEVAFRTALSDTLCVNYGPHWYLNSNLFGNNSWHQAFIQQVQEVCQREPDHHIKNYSNSFNMPELPPSWIVIEHLPFGACTSTFRNLKKLNDKKNISKVFNYHPTAIESWIEALRYTRNLCAHHSRLYNRWFVVTPKLAYLFRGNFDRNHTFYAQAIVMERLLRTISPGTHWLSKLFCLLEQHDFISIQRMGFDVDWKNDSFWQSIA